MGQFLLQGKIELIG